MATLVPNYFETTIAQDMTAPAALTSQVITVANGGAIPEVTAGNQIWAWIGNANVEASLEAVLITSHAEGSTSVTVTRAADNDPAYPPVTHEEGQGFYGPALLGSFFDEIPTEAAAAFSGTVRFTGDITPTAFAANTNDWNPTGLATANVIRAAASGAARDLTGLVAQEDGREFRVENISAFNITLKDQDALSAAANRFDLTTDHVLLPGGFVVLKYDGTTQRWRATPSVNGVIFQNFGTDVQQAPRVDVQGNLFSITYDAPSNTLILKQFDASLGDITGLDESARLLKDPVRVASTGNITISSPGASIDGVALSSFNEVLLKDQTAPEENGIYRWNGAASAMTRAFSASTAAEFPTGFKVYVKEGTANAGKFFVHTTTAAITLGTTALTFQEAGGVGSIAAHLADTADAHDASAISFTPAGSIAATDVQAAIEEVASEAGGSAFVGVRATSVGYTVPDATITRVILDTEDYDTNDDVKHFLVDDDLAGSGITGTVDVTASSPTVAGTGTSFTTELSVGQIISIGGTYRVIATITDNDTLDTLTDWPITLSGQNCYRSTGVSIITAGTYRLAAALDYGPNATGIRRLHLDVNQQGNGIEVDIRPAVTGEATPLRVGGDFELAAGDALLLFTYQDSGGTRYYYENFTPFLTVHKVG